MGIDNNNGQSHAKLDHYCLLLLFVHVQYSCAYYIRSLFLARWAAGNRYDRPGSPVRCGVFASSHTTRPVARDGRRGRLR